MFRVQRNPQKPFGVILGRFQSDLELWKQKIFNFLKFFHSCSVICRSFVLAWKVDKLWARKMKESNERTRIENCIHIYIFNFFCSYYLKYMLRQTSGKRRNNYGKISKNSKFKFFKFDPKLIGNHLETSKKLSKAILENFESISERN